MTSLAPQKAQPRSDSVPGMVWALETGKEVARVLALHLQIDVLLAFRNVLVAFQQYHGHGYVSLAECEGYGEMRLSVTWKTEAAGHPYRRKRAKFREAGGNPCAERFRERESRNCGLSPKNRRSKRYDVRKFQKFAVGALRRRLACDLAVKTRAGTPVALLLGEQSFGDEPPWTLNPQKQARLKVRTTPGPGALRVAVASRDGVRDQPAFRPGGGIPGVRRHGRRRGS